MLSECSQPQNDDKSTQDIEYSPLICFKRSRIVQVQWLLMSYQLKKKL